MKYLLNSAVITSEGEYSYRRIGIDEAKRFVSTGPWVSYIGYIETAEALSTLLGVPIPVHRGTVQMAVGDLALVFRLVFPSGYRPDPAQKGKLGVDFIRENMELGILIKK
jgi:hypothetical protein